MKTIFYAFGALLLVSAVTVLYKMTAAADSGVSSVTVAHRPELEYLKAVNSVAPVLGFIRSAADFHPVHTLDSNTHKRRNAG